MIREVREETGLEIEPLQMVEVFERIVRDKSQRVEYHFVLIDYLCGVISGEAHADSDVSELRWVTIEELQSFNVAPDTCGVIRKAFSI